MNEQYFQVNVELATPACDANCPNLQIDIRIETEALNGGFLHKKTVHCVNDTWCQQLYRAIEKNQKNVSL